MKPRTIRELDALPKDEAAKIWASLSEEEQVKLANAMTAEEIAAMPKKLTDVMRGMKANTLNRALGELEAAQTTEGTFIFTGDGDTFELTEEYCTRRLTELKTKFEGETEESIGFHGYHNLRLWIEAYEVLLNEYKKKGN
jgi:hypothetical protein